MAKVYNPLIPSVNSMVKLLRERVYSLKLGNITL